MGIKFSLARLPRVFVFLSILTVWITQPIGGYLPGSIFGRVVLSDVFLLVAVLIYFLSKIPIRSTLLQTAFLTFICYSFIGVLYSSNPTLTVTESIALLFLFLGFTINIKLFSSEKDLLRLIYVFSICGLIASIVGIYDFTATIIGTPRVFNPPKEARTFYGLSGFRNSGQAGAFILIILGVNIAILKSKISTLFSKTQRSFIVLSLIIGIVFLFLTVKIAAYIGFLALLAIYSIFKWNLSLIKITAVVTIIIVVGGVNLETISPKFYNILHYKMQTRVYDNVDKVSGESDDSEDGFMEHNILGAVESFIESPLVGSGFGGFQGNGGFEIHSTYFKMLGEGGTIGVLLYIILMHLLFLKFRARHYKNEFASFLGHLYPIFIGFMVSWTYTYHLRKREFWILVVIIFLVSELAKRKQQNALLLKSL